MPESQRARAIALIEHVLRPSACRPRGTDQATDPRGRHRRHPLRLGRRHHAGPAALLPAARPDAADRVRPDRRRPRPLGLARPDQPFRRGPSARPSRGGARRRLGPAARHDRERAGEEIRARRNCRTSAPGPAAARRRSRPSPARPGSIIGPICSPLTPSAPTTAPLVSPPATTRRRAPAATSAGRDLGHRMLDQAAGTIAAEPALDGLHLVGRRAGVDQHRPIGHAVERPRRRPAPGRQPAASCPGSSRRDGRAGRHRRHLLQRRRRAGAGQDHLAAR